jgi:DnaJ-class molecular chaperone
MPAVVRSGFNSASVKKAYRGLARKYHPDKVNMLPQEE